MTRPGEDTDDAQAQCTGDAPLNDQAPDNSQAARGSRATVADCVKSRRRAQRSHASVEGRARLVIQPHQAHSQQQRYEGQRVRLPGS